jgi:DnaJ-class molecular chaperone
MSKTDYEKGQEDMRNRATKAVYNMDGEVKCGACNGSGHYDNTGSPPCGSCDGKGETSATVDDVGYMISQLEIKPKE